MQSQDCTKYLGVCAKFWLKNVKPDKTGITLMFSSQFDKVLPESGSSKEMEYSINEKKVLH